MADQKADLVRWFRECDFDAYTAEELQAAYDALVGYVCDHPSDKRVTYGRDAAAPLGRETDTTYCDLCGERVG